MTHPRLLAMRRRAQRIRRTVATAAVAVFIALFSTIYVQMGAGNDPALTASTSTTTNTTSTDDSTTSSEDDEPAAVTTRQS